MLRIPSKPTCSKGKILGRLDYLDEMRKRIAALEKKEETVDNQLSKQNSKINSFRQRIESMEAAVASLKKEVEKMENRDRATLGA